MKVCTDACILGAWFAEKIPEQATILDIGSGTGLLMMMLAQKSEAYIHGIEIDISCFKQLEENIGHTKWKDRLTVHPGDVRSYSFPHKFDFIITNPPFYENDLPSHTEKEKLAKHSRELSLKELLEVVDRNLSVNGSFGILLPVDRWEYFNRLSKERDFCMQQKLFVRHSAAHPVTRAILHYSRQNDKYIPTFELNVHREKEPAGYTEEFIELMREYYLYL
jgi:tRNA1Val (adenine37-N6)-methyltransferase